MGEFDNLKVVNIPISDLLDICERCKTEDDAKKVLNQMIEQSDSPEIATENLGYIFGYAGEEERKRLYSLFHLSHPIFGEGFGKGDDGKYVESLKEAIGNNIETNNDRCKKED